MRTDATRWKKDSRKLEPPEGTGNQGRTSTNPNPYSVNPDPKTPEQDTGANLHGLPTSRRGFQAEMGRASAYLNSGKIHLLQPTPERATIDHYQATGARLEGWMANTNPAGPACRVAPSTLTIDALVRANAPNEPAFIVMESKIRCPTA
ncbi:hypothetical protein PDIG_05610 [Penicillium digitatum PHI26]|uniref:Uncharacterized protein n=2 Tax=Penicillium digitatum TaxID=36651 RepID=K9GD71_PEND2|nr:hypothetical protein PDIP_10280 [Penicillium digitatum Pd1]EKV19064.1 hypothetical protein PDIG_05610 [Penicillium digitatum PHI26]EKV21074.1 hypothetical protein PDIP_10280 [Penicillium digitatum Pd1]